MYQNEGKGFSIGLILVVTAVIGFVAVFYQHIGPFVIEKVTSREATQQQDITVKELEQMLSEYMSDYESNMLVYNEYRKTAFNDNKREADQHLKKARKANELYKETYNENRELAKYLPADSFPEELE